MVLLWVQWILFLIVTGYAVYVSGAVIYSRYVFIRSGRASDSRVIWKERLPDFLTQVFGQRKLLSDRRSGIMHAVIFYGFIIVQLGAIDIVIKGLGGHGLPVPGYAVFGLIQEVTVVSILLAVAYAAYRRYGERLPRLSRGLKPSLVLYFISTLMLSVLFTLAFEQLMHGIGPSWHAPVSSLIALALSPLGSSAAVVAFYVSWWAHLLILLAFLIYVPQSKHFHLITAPINLLLKRSSAPGRLIPLDLEDEEAESYGVGAIDQFTQHQLLDLYACVECGRCTNVCPASNTGQSLSPMHLMTKLRDHLTESSAERMNLSASQPAYLFRSQSGAHRIEHEAMRDESDWAGREGTDISPTMTMQQRAWRVDEGAAASELRLHGDVMTAGEIWACTTCRNCEEVCPVGNEHVDKIIDLRRYLVLMEGSLPAEGQRALMNIERQGNPWGISRSERAAWTDQLAEEGVIVPTVRDRPDFELLLFVGSMASYDTRSRKIVKSLVRLLHAAGVRYAILGNEEHSSGDTARRMGNELLYQELAASNIALFEQYGVRRIVTPCPHTYNTFKHEYPDFGLAADVEVLHHSELLATLVREGRLKPKRPIEARITFHDSCYLGRYNGIYDAPRDVLEALPGVQLVEMERSRANAMCCGAGGGMMWMEQQAGKRVNVARTEQALAVEPDVITSACPYCLTMMEDGVKQLGADGKTSAQDIAEILERAVLG